MRKKENLKVVYLHGLDAQGIGPKHEYLDTFGTAIYPQIEYRDVDAWDKIKKIVEREKPDYIIGSSMGGWFAFNLGNLLNIPTVLFNPALQGRTIEPVIPKEDLKGKYRPLHVFTLGRKDVVVKASETIVTLDKTDIKYVVDYNQGGHRISEELFIRTVRLNTK